MRKTASRGRRGAVILETALVTPLLLVIVCGIVETAFLMKANHALAALVTEGGRGASSAGAGNALPSLAAACVGATCTADNTPALADAAAAAIERADAALPKDSIEELWVYKANRHGYPGPSDNTSFRSCRTSCVVYRWSPEHHSFDYAGGRWSRDDAGACPEAADSVGVYLKATHSLLAGLISGGVHISDHAVFPFRPAGGCAEHGG